MVTSIGGALRLDVVCGLTFAVRSFEPVASIWPSGCQSMHHMLPPMPSSDKCASSTESISFSYLHPRYDTKGWHMQHHRPGHPEFKAAVEISAGKQCLVHRVPGDGCICDDYDDYSSLIIIRRTFDGELVAAELLQHLHLSNVKNLDRFVAT